MTRRRCLPSLGPDPLLVIGLVLYHLPLWSVQIVVEHLRARPR